MSSIYTIRKYMGDDSYSWAVFQNRVVIQALTGLNHSQAQYFCRQLESEHKENLKKEKE